MFLCLLGALCTLKLDIRHILEAVGWYLCLCNEMTSVSRVFDSAPHALKEPSYLVCRRRAPCLPCVVVAVIDELSMLEYLPQLNVH